MTSAAAAAPPVSAFAPLRKALFRSLWVATLASNIGTWMQNVGAGWLMTSLSSSPAMVALVSAAGNLPMFLFALPAGALADVMDRRRVLLWTQSWMFLCAAALGVCTALGAINAWSLLFLTAALGIGAAFNAPAWQATTPEIVSPDELPAAISLGSAGFNLSRAIGPALGGLVVAAAGPAANFGLNALSFLGVIFVLARWRRERKSSPLPGERFIGAMKTGARYVRHAPEMHAVLARTLAFAACGTALWALLPLVARTELKMGPLGYGALLGCLGAGALGGALAMPRLREKMRIDTVLNFATALFALATLALAFFQNIALVCAALLLGGAAWLAMLSSLNITAQTSIPAWVRARALSVYLLIFFGGMTLGSALWGAVAEHAGLRATFEISAAGLLASLVLARVFPLHDTAMHKLVPSLHWPEPAVVTADVPMEGAPVLVTVEYCIQPARAKDFAAAMQALRRHRLRDGAMRWGLFADLAEPGRYMESFIVESWAEHLRQHARATVSDREAEEAALAFHTGAEPPAVRHFIAELPV